VKIEKKKSMGVLEKMAKKKEKEKNCHYKCEKGC